MADFDGVDDGDGVKTPLSPEEVEDAEESRLCEPGG